MLTFSSHRGGSSDESHLQRNIEVEGRGGDETDCRLKHSILCLKGILQLIKQFSYECMNNGMTCSEHSAASQLHQNVNSEARYSCNHAQRRFLRKSGVSFISIFELLLRGVALQEEA